MPNQKLQSGLCTAGNLSGRQIGRRLQPLGELSSQDLSSFSRKKRETVSKACNSCQKRKSKCDGSKPGCSMCIRKRTKCEYSADLRRTSNLRNLAAQLYAHIKHYEQAFHDLRTGKIPEACLALSKIRDVDIEQLLEQSRETIHGSRPPMLQNSGQESLGLASLQSLTLRSGESSPPIAGPSSAGFCFNTVPESAVQGQPEENPHSCFPTLREDDLLVGSRMTFDPKSFQNMLVPESRLLPLNPPGQDPFGNELGKTYDDLFRAFQLSRRELIRNGVSPAEVIGDPELDVSAVFSQDELRRAHPMVDFVVRLMRSLNYDQFYKLALMHVRYRMLRWMIYPCDETFESLPATMKPTPAQLRYSHPNWVDFIVAPTLRNMFILQPETRSLEWYRATDTMMLSWRGTMQEAVLCDLSTGAQRLSPAFIKHADDPANYTMSEAGLTAVPQAEGQIGIRRRQASP